MAGAATARRECRRQLCHQWPRHGLRTKRKNFPDDKGFYVREHEAASVTFELQDSDVVCFRSAPADADGYHSLVQTGGVRPCRRARR